jgi:hypothetical protein
MLAEIAVEPLCRGLALRDFLVEGCYPAGVERLADNAGARIATNANPNAAARQIVEKPACQEHHATTRQQLLPG